MVSMRPYTPDPYPERSRRHPGVRPSEATNPPPAQTFTTRPAASRSVVQPTTPHPARMITEHPASRHPVPFGANWTMSARPCAGHTTNARTPLDPNRRRLTRPADDRASHDHDQHPEPVR